MVQGSSRPSDPKKAIDAFRHRPPRCCSRARPSSAAPPGATPVVAGGRPQEARRSFKLVAAHLELDGGSPPSPLPIQPRSPSSMPVWGCLANGRGDEDPVAPDDRGRVTESGHRSAPAHVGRPSPASQVSGGCCPIGDTRFPPAPRNPGQGRGSRHRHVGILDLRLRPRRSRLASMSSPRMGSVTLDGLRGSEHDQQVDHFVGLPMRPAACWQARSFTPWGTSIALEHRLDHVRVAVARRRRRAHRRPPSSPSRSGPARNREYPSQAGHADRRVAIEVVRDPRTRRTRRPPGAAQASGWSFAAAK